MVVLLECRPGHGGLSRDDGGALRRDGGLKAEAYGAPHNNMKCGGRFRRYHMEACLAYKPSHTSHQAPPQSAPDRRFANFRCTAIEIGYSTAKYSDEKLCHYFMHMHMRTKTIWCGCERAKFSMRADWVRGGGGLTRHTTEGCPRQETREQLRAAEDRSKCVRVRVDRIGHLKSCMTDLYLDIDARTADYIRTHPYERGWCK